jgi:hypothetical protein
MKIESYKHHALLFLLLLSVLLVPGPGMPAAEEAKLSLSEATAALTRMGSEKDWDEVPHARPVPPTDQFKMDKAGLYTSGPWDIHPEHKTFVFTLERKGGFWQRSGTFVRNDQLKWQAKVEREVRTAH